jgi:RNA polymerase sigma-70 factor (ECF subfamily)
MYERATRALQDLPEQMRRCFILRFDQQLRYREIAAVMQISIQTVKSHLHQARERLKAILAEDL